jgi:Transposase, Mutator family
MEPYHALEPQLPGGPPIEIGPGPAAETTEPPEPITPTALPAISETLEEVVREGARRMLERALCAEVDAYLGRRRYDRVDDDFSGYRNGFARDREITIGSWAVEVRQPRVSDVPEHSPSFRSSILPRGRASARPPSGCSPGCISKA